MGGTQRDEVRNRHLSSPLDAGVHMTARSLKPLFAASALAMLIASSAHADPPANASATPVPTHPFQIHHEGTLTDPSMTCDPPEAGETPSLGCTKAIEYDQNLIRSETANCKAGKITPKTCARDLEAYRTEIKEMGYHPR